MPAGHRVIAPETAQVVDLVAAARMLQCRSSMKCTHPRWLIHRTRRPLPLGSGGVAPTWVIAHTGLCAWTG